MTECPSCDRDDFEKESSMKIHHSMIHGESIAGEPVDCDNCGETVRKKRGDIEKWDNHFCGDECRFEYTRGENHHQYERTEVDCSYCGDSVKKHPRDIKRNSDDYYCDMECRNNHYKEEKVPTGEDHPSWTEDVITVCEYCDSEYTHKKSRESKFCSKSCQSKWMSKNLTGENSPAWKGGYENNSRYYGSNWDNKRQEVIELDNYTCQGCGSVNNLQVHHIIPIKTFDNVNDANYKENLVTLCPSCHGEIEVLERIEQLKRLKLPRLQM